LRLTSRRAAGARKWDVDGNEYVDYWMGHGSLLLGHCHHQVVQAVAEQLSRGTHYGACYPLEVEWAEIVVGIVPSAEMVRFTTSGTEAVMLALKLARAFTGKEKVVMLDGGFHGWSDYTQVVEGLGHAGAVSRGIPDAVRGTVLLAPPNNAAAVMALLESRSDIACILVEPGGGLVSRLPTSREYLRQLRNAASRYGVALIFDEVVTGFRYAPGGCQEYWGVVPDLTVLGKILGGGMPGVGAVAGKKEIMTFLTRKGNEEWDCFRRVEHHGTFNAAPTTAAAGIAALNIVRDGEAILEADRQAGKLRRGLNEAFSRHNVRSCAYGRSSLVLPLLNCECPRSFECETVDCSLDYREVNRFDPELHRSLREHLLLQGVDVFPAAMFVSSAHDDHDIDWTLQAWDATVMGMKNEGLLKARI